MARLPETTQEWLERYEKRYERAYYNYQNSGEQRYDSQSYEYSVICDALRAKLKMESERDDEIRKRMRNCNHMTENLLKDTYTKAEVIEMLGKAVWW